ncbi:formyltetrahydrofolate deformylase [Williamsia sp. CHRR-6]|uniref:formyltetrahydrofolate deformylase n=1 Tax=Williamsia sp. CHRR-6 TaxID=2835871 RepID=UPI001BDB03CF|nr:formyltetrahydrofolate deformylase [Williamsia sp. CHRR-6]MBT0567676.1 formyltetrahydrofolate deformylase [Williamsia sp. CHRR-6]
MSTQHVVTLTCQDRPGIVHAVTAGLLQVGANVVENAQFTDHDTGTFCMRTVVSTPDVESVAVHAAVAGALRPGAADPGARLRVRPLQRRPRVLILVSRHDHCLVDLLYRWRGGMLPIDICAIVSNHPDARPLAEGDGIEFHHLPVTKDTKAAQEQQILELVDSHAVDLVVLARYMQILSDRLCAQLSGRAINIHHSFLPGFKGARPYHQAHERGVKLIGATAHFVTADLDEGPIIEQDVARVSHTHTAEQLVELGQDTERLVLARAVRAYAEDRVFLVGHKTVVFP